LRQLANLVAAVRTVTVPVDYRAGRKKGNCPTSLAGIHLGPPNPNGLKISGSD
jgi:hypothetical protein